MSKFKDFGSGPDLSKLEEISFQLYGEKFECVKAIQGRVLLDLVKSASSDDPIAAAGVVDSFFSKVLTDESLTRFNALLDDKDKVVTVDTLGELTGWIVEQLSNRPESQPEV
jgi:hypothetical protein